MGCVKYVNVFFYVGKMSSSVTFLVNFLFLLMIKMHKLTVCISSVLFFLDFLFRLVILTYSGSLQRSGARRGEEMVGADLGNPDGREGEGPEGQGGSTA